MTTVKINNNHDYITVRVTFAPKDRVNLTWSRSGMKLSGTSGSWIAHGKAIMTAMECPKGRTIGDWTKQIANRAVLAETVSVLADRMRCDCGAVPSPGYTCARCMGSRP